MRNLRGAAISFFLAVILASGALGQVWVTDRQLERAKRRAQTEPWARAVVDAVVADADRWLRSPLPFPEGLSGYFHDYFCPDHAVQLLFDPNEPHRHVCPVDGRIFQGEKYDAAWVYLVHFRAAEALQDLAVAYEFTGNPAYAQAALDWLRQVRDRYRLLPLHGQHAGRGKLMAQSLDEAFWAVVAARAYEILRREGFISDDEHRRFVRLLWRPMYQLIAGQPQFRGRIHNITCWHDAAMASIAVLVGDRALLRYAIDNPTSGLKAQLLRGVDRDGLWYEGSLGYHFYALDALLVGAWVAKNDKMPLGAAGESLVRMLRLPLQLADLHGNLPALNDGWPNQKVQSYLRLYEWAFSLLPESGLDTLWARFAPGKRSTVESLFFGPDSLPKETASRRSALLRHSGLAVLRDGALYVLFDFGPHGGGHGHFDKLQFLVSYRGHWLSPDYGTAGYGIPAYREWYKRTASHNTISVDGRCQRPGKGQLLAYGRAGRWQIVRASTGDVYDGVELDRSVLVSGGRLVVVDWVRSDQQHILDWHFRAGGELTLSVPDSLMKPTSIGGDGYEYYQDVKCARVDGNWSAVWRGENGDLCLSWDSGTRGDSVYTGEEPGIPMTKTYPFIMVRRRARSAVFLASFAVGGMQPETVVLESPDPEGGQLRIRLGEGSHAPRLYLARPAHRVRVDDIQLACNTALVTGGRATELKP